MPPLAAVACLCDISNGVTSTLTDSLAYPRVNIPESVKRSWTAKKSSSLYKVEGWGAPYFFINAAGHMAIRPMGNSSKPQEEMDIMGIVQHIIESKVLGDLALPTPLILRFPDILRDRLHKLQSAFDRAIHAYHYQGHFQGVFPVKCNQDRHVVENIVELGKPFGFGLEAGSKPELLLAMGSLCKGSPDALLVCNGYKDADYVCLALLARQLHLKCVIVLEQEQELDVVLRMSCHLGIDPLLGLRAKLNTKHAGHFGETSGEDGKFGLSCSQIVAIVQKLRKLGKLHCLQLLHFHIGSQIPSLAIVHDGVSEAVHIYCELALMGADMQFLDIGGGLGIDYDGSASAQSDMSVGYTIEGYAKQVVQAVKSACDMKGVKQPTLCSESGRALVSHHSVLVFDVLSAQHRGGRNLNTKKGISVDVDETLPDELRTLHQSLVGFIQAGDLQNVKDCASKLKGNSVTHFKQGKLSLMQLSAINNIHEAATELTEVMRERDMISTFSPFVRKSFESFDLHDNGQDDKGYGTHDAIYHINLSVFRSMPDTWAIGQLFPIVPLHRLDEEPMVNAILSDLTCDSDGKVTAFVGSNVEGRHVKHLKLHHLQDGKSYYVGMFLGGAYQEALGSMHNLYGSLPVVHVTQSVKSRGIAELNLKRVSGGQKIADVLQSMQYNPNTILEVLAIQLQKCFSEVEFSEDEREKALAVLRTLACSFSSSTYLSNNHQTSSVFHNLFKKSTIVCEHK
ncbi:hypothetical protein KP509_27G065700 [Ceratopteris richardii]|uniref:Arginine decarboxylase n=1 Tax=Ceratopteris richardii TaxID=49495 RepID=A0A8T2RHA1_CERRI|nr:hypothetical protein KP509_27G065700 [Ceratopteris richardii]KAH7295780.1 hypothetical protein KP509_27G065700 [Ceratopteris richardii]KAH7295781.1 hypothetical protein KP509_27G065700 [Ceratopteris richardii]KAH7295782.1 hypothetical protein KP509_27G065700 [Ceratopteris richardii]KAH7295783.1 hypothetical protein KP509_27G065700 [Ceratopteris richardii]